MRFNMKNTLLTLLFFSQLTYANVSRDRLENKKSGAAAQCTDHAGRILEHGQKYFAFKEEFAQNGNTCDDIMEERECINGVVTGSYIHEFCNENKSCETDGSVVEHGMELKLYREPIAREFPKCESQVRKCVDGSFDGTDEFTYSSCETPKQKNKKIAKAYEKLYKVAQKNGDYSLLNKPIFKDYQKFLREQALEEAKK